MREKTTTPVPNQKVTTEWHHVDDSMPIKNKCVLVFMEYSTYPFGAAFYNGVKWVGIDLETEICNVEFWCEVTW